MLRPIRFSLVTLVLALSACFGAGAAAAQTALPPSLEGETFQAYEYRSASPEDPSVVVEGGLGEIAVDASCTGTAGETFTIRYSAEGPALGPYPGTFTETGTITVTALGGGAGGAVISWTANFTIDSAIGQVSGKKTLSQTLFANCVHEDEFFDVGPGFVDIQVANASLHYEATIRTASGTFTDQGDAQASVLQLCGGLSRPTCDFAEEEGFLESFTLSRGVLPLDATGKATGGGQIGDLTSLARVSFGFEVKQPETGRLQGRCLVNDPAASTRVKCLTVTSYQQIGNTATWEGTAEVNGDREHYRITVQDNGEPNQGIDMFSIKTDTYEAAGNVQHGNVQLHKQQLGL
jgi:hypothetical protein